MDLCKNLSHSSASACLYASLIPPLVSADLLTWRTNYGQSSLSTRHISPIHAIRVPTLLRSVFHKRISIKLNYMVYVLLWLWLRGLLCAQIDFAIFSRRVFNGMINRSYMHTLNYTWRGTIILPLKNCFFDNKRSIRYINYPALRLQVLADKTIPATAAEIN